VARRADKEGKHGRAVSQYAAGEHRASLTQEKQLLHITEAEVGSPFNINHLDNIIQTVADRLEVSKISSDSTENTNWLGLRWRSDSRYLDL
jgi:hypothetical protein